MSPNAASEDTAQVQQPAEETPGVATSPVDNLPFLEDIPVTVTVELGHHWLTLDEALNLEEQSVIELGKTTGQPMDILINGRLFARGEVVIIAEETYGIRLTEIVGQM